MPIEVTKKSRVIAGRTASFVNAQYGHLLKDLPGGQNFGLDKYDLMPVREPMVRRNKAESAHPRTWGYHLSKSNHLRNKEGHDPKEKWLTEPVEIIDQFAVPGQEVWS